MRGNEDEDVEELTMSDGEGGEEEARADYKEIQLQAHLRVYLIPSGISSGISSCISSGVSQNKKSKNKNKT